MDIYLMIKDEDKSYRYDLIDFKLESKLDIFGNSLSSSKTEKCKVTITLPISSSLSKDYIKRLSDWEQECFDYRQKIFSYPVGEECKCYKTLYLYKYDGENIKEAYKLNNSLIEHFKATKKKITIELYVSKIEDITKETYAPKRKPGVHHTIASYFGM